jgi:hypothetical protein
MELSTVWQVGLAVWEVDSSTCLGGRPGRLGGTRHPSGGSTPPVWEVNSTRMRQPFGRYAWAVRHPCEGRQATTSWRHLTARHGASAAPAREQRPPATAAAPAPHSDRAPRRCRRRCHLTARHGAGAAPAREHRPPAPAAAPAPHSDRAPRRCRHRRHLTARHGAGATPAREQRPSRCRSATPAKQRRPPASTAAGALLRPAGPRPESFAVFLWPQRSHDGQRKECVAWRVVLQGGSWLLGHVLTREGGEGELLQVAGGCRVACYQLPGAAGGGLFESNNPPGRRGAT